MYNFIQMRLFSLVMWLPTRHIYTRVLIPTVVVQKAIQSYFARQPQLNAFRIRLQQQATTSLQLNPKHQYADNET